MKPQENRSTPARLLRKAEVLARTGLSDTTIWRLEKRGEFPKGRRLSPGRVGYLESEVQAWIDPGSTNTE
jgi:prophage regulatory protein